MVAQSALKRRRSAGDVRTGCSDDFEERCCVLCGGVHFAFFFAPSEAPCAACARLQTPPPPKSGKRWSKHFLAWLELRTP